MSDYTPTTEAVRNAFAKCRGCYRCESDGDGDDRPSHKAEFDRWLASVKAEAWDECAAEVEGCHDCLAYQGISNPYREAVTE